MKNSPSIHAGWRGTVPTPQTTKPPGPPSLASPGALAAQADLRHARRLLRSPRRRLSRTVAQRRVILPQLQRVDSLGTLGGEPNNSVSACPIKSGKGAAISAGGGAGTRGHCTCTTAGASGAVWHAASVSARLPASVQRSAARQQIVHPRAGAGQGLGVCMDCLQVFGVGFGHQALQLALQLRRSSQRGRVARGHLRAVFVVPAGGALKLHVRGAVGQRQPGHRQRPQPAGHQVKQPGQRLEDGGDHGAGPTGPGPGVSGNCSVATNSSGAGSFRVPSATATSSEK